MGRNPKRERLRARQACQNCRRKKARCTSERPACSTCVRLNQSCVYDTTNTPDRLSTLEKKVELILSDRQQRYPYASEDLSRDQTRDESEPEPLAAFMQVQASTQTEISSRHCPSRNPDSDRVHAHQPEFYVPKLDISESAVLRGLDLYFERFHRQPIWCFDRQDLGHITEMSTELTYSILELTGQVSGNSDPRRYGESARWSIMFRVANGTVELQTVESLCLLSYSAFIDGAMHLGQFYLGLGFQLYRSTCNANPTFEREKSLFWSLQSLEQFYGDQISILRTATEHWRSYYLSNRADTEYFPRELNRASAPPELGIWSLSVHFGWIWSRVREYVSECSRNELVEPWRLDSPYARILANMMEIENKASLKDRYHVVKFYARRPDEVQSDREYWMPWLKVQFVWHAILTMVNHPFLYITASRHHPTLVIPNTFWRKSLEQVLLHATWTVRTIDMIHEKNVKVLDPFFGHAAAIAATVHLYFFCTADLRLRQKSKTDHATCRDFLQSLSVISPACGELSQLLDRTTRKALQSEEMDFDRAPSRIHLPIALMWAVLKFDVSGCRDPAAPSASPSCPLSSTLGDAPGQGRQGETLEIGATAPPTPVVMNVDPASGHDARLPLYKSKASSTSPPAAPPPPPGSNTREDPVEVPFESGMFDSSWLWGHSSVFADINDGAYIPSDPTVESSSAGFSTWWNSGNL